MKPLHQEQAAKWWPISIWMVCAVLTAMVQYRILTYVSGQDPFMYLRLANRAAAEPPGQALQMLAKAPFSPAYSFLLYLAIQAGGILAPYWLNFAGFLCLLLTLALLFTRVLHRTQDAALVLMTVLFFLVIGYPLNMHFLLYPFRGLPALLFMAMGIHLFFRGLDGRDLRPWSMAGAAVAFIAAILMREPSVLGMAGPLIWALCCCRMSWHLRMKNLLWFALPWVLALAAWLICSAVTGRLVTQQFSSWAQVVFGLGPAHTWQQFIFNAREMAEFLPGEFGWVGLALVAAGIVAQRRNTRLLLGFLLSAILFFLFYSIYEAHRRYFLNTVFFLSPFAGCALASAAHTIFRISRANKRCIQVSLIVSPILVMSIWASISARRLEPWGLRVTGKQALDLHRTARAVADPGDMIFVDPRCRYMVDAVVSLTDLYVAHPRAVQRLLNEGRHCLFAKPLNRACYYKGTMLNQYDGINVSDMVCFYADAVPVKNADGKPKMLWLGQAQYGLYEVCPWTAMQAEREITAALDTGTIIWVDMGAVPGNQLSRIRLQQSDGKPLQQWDTVKGGSIHGLYVTQAVPTDAICKLVVSSDQPLPANPPVIIADPGDMTRFPLDVRRSPSTHEWLQPPFETPNTDHKYGAAFSSGGHLYLPPVHGAGPFQIKVRFVMSPVSRIQEYIRIQFMHAQEILVDKQVSLAEGKFWSLVTVQPVKAGGRSTLKIKVEPPDCYDTYLRIQELGFEVVPVPKPE